MGSGAESRGGGALRILTPNLHIDGEILANGEADIAPAPTGSGGSVWITCGSLSGAGKIAASGGALSGPQVQAGGCGAGGRVAQKFLQL